MPGNKCMPAACQACQACWHMPCNNLQPTTTKKTLIYTFLYYILLLITPLYYDKRLNIYIAIVEYTDLRVLNCTQYHLINTFIDK